MATCSPSDLLEEGKCFQCLTKKELQVVIAQLLCEISSGGGSSGPKAYRALLSQSGTDAPVATVLENSLSGVPVWSRNGVGNYTVSLSGEFPLGKTFMLACADANNSNGMVLGLGQDNADGINVFVWGSQVSAGNVALRDLAGGLTSVEILVYP